MKLTPALIKRCHLVAAVMWVILAIPSLIWWKTASCGSFSLASMRISLGIYLDIAQRERIRRRKRMKIPHPNKGLVIRGIYDGY